MKAFLKPVCFSKKKTNQKNNQVQLTLICNRLYLEACEANDGTAGIDMMVVTLLGLEIKGAGQLAPKTT